MIFQHRPSSHSAGFRVAPTRFVLAASIACFTPGLASSATSDAAGRSAACTVATIQAAASSVKCQAHPSVGAIAYEGSRSGAALPRQWRRASQTSIRNGITLPSLSGMWADVDGYPIFPCVPEIVGGEETATFTAALSPVAGGSGAQISCDHPELLVSPGASWPYTVAATDGSASVTCSFATRSATAATTVTIYSVAPGTADPSDPSNWTSSVTITLVPSDAL